MNHCFARRDKRQIRFFRTICLRWNLKRANQDAPTFARQNRCGRKVFFSRLRLHIPEEIPGAISHSDIRDSARAKLLLKLHDRDDHDQEA